MRFTRIAALLGLSLVACRGGGGSGDDVVDPDGPPVGGVVHIQDIQNDAMAKGTAVELRGVVVTAIDSFGARTGDLWVEEPGGGEFSGVKVFGAPLDQIAALQPGDIVSISNAEKDEFALMDDMTGRTTTEIKGAGGGTMTITKTGSGALPTPATVDAKAISELADQAAQDAEWEKWEGVLINVTNARQTGAVTTFGSTPAPDATKFKVTGGLVVESVLSAFPATSVAGVCYEGITGIGDYFFDYLLLPKADTDLVTGGTGCTPLSVATIAQVQGGTITGDVQLNDVFVTGIGFMNKKFLWVASSLTASPNDAVQVFMGTSTPAPDGVVIGSKVSIIGTVQEFNDDTMGTALTEVSFASVTPAADAPGTVVPVTNKTVAQLMNAQTGATFESVAVTLSNVNLTVIGTSTNGFIATAVQNGTSFGVGTDILHVAATDLGCYNTVTGFWTSLQASATQATTKPNALGFIVQTLGTKGTSCN